MFLRSMRVFMRRWLKLASNSISRLVTAVSGTIKNWKDLTSFQCGIQNFILFYYFFKNRSIVHDDYEPINQCTAASFRYDKATFSSATASRALPIVESRLTEPMTTTMTATMMMMTTTTTTTNDVRNSATVHVERYRAAFAGTPYWWRYRFSSQKHRSNNWHKSFFVLFLKCLLLERLNRAQQATKIATTSVTTSALTTATSEALLSTTTTANGVAVAEAPKKIPSLQVC